MWKTIGITVLRCGAIYCVFGVFGVFFFIFKGPRSLVLGRGRRRWIRMPFRARGDARIDPATGEGDCLLTPAQSMCESGSHEPNLCDLPLIGLDPSQGGCS